MPICSANLQVQPGWTLLNTEAMEAIPAENTGPRSVLSCLVHSLEGDGAETKMKTPFQDEDSLPLCLTQVSSA